MLANVCTEKGVLFKESGPESVSPDSALEAAVLQLLGVCVKRWQLHTALDQQSPRIQRQIPHETSIVIGPC